FRGRGLRLWRGIGDGPQRVDHLRTLLVVLKRIEGSLCLFGGQHIGIVRVRCRRRGTGLSSSREREQHEDDQDRSEELVRHEQLFEFFECVYAQQQAENRFAVAHSSMSSSPFRRRPVSEVCYRGGFLLASTQSTASNW